MAESTTGQPPRVPIADLEIPVGLYEVISNHNYQYADELDGKEATSLLQWQSVGKNKVLMLQQALEKVGMSLQFAPEEMKWVEELATGNEPKRGQNWNLTVLTDSQKQGLLDGYRSGHSKYSLSKALDLPYTAVSREFARMEEAGEKRGALVSPTKGITGEEVETIRRMALNGTAQLTMAESVGRSLASVTRVLLLLIRRGVLVKKGVGQYKEGKKQWAAPANSPIRLPESASRLTRTPKGAGALPKALKALKPPTLSKKAKARKWYEANRDVILLQQKIGRLKRTSKYAEAKRATAQLNALKAAKELEMELDETPRKVERKTPTRPKVFDGTKEEFTEKLNTMSQHHAQEAEQDAREYREYIVGYATGRCQEWLANLSTQTGHRVPAEELARRVGKLLAGEKGR
jgi:hypothetical protein